jgi:hypothetical protein
MTLIYKKMQHPYNRMPLVTDQAAAFTGIGSGLAEVLTDTHKFGDKIPGLSHKVQILFFKRDIFAAAGFFLLNLKYLFERLEFY